ncbi:hypothetical protein RchiOBHm_Chr6g0309001 [Rosa chinensis]|uniref:Uncharacterized protein n=1 Tax=Rosa chinensis TaxID=74649 RepID=A0A2P6Q0R1_ROSCH|nr:hypothetical protein RchiOBHm_Chr6g0309001 [Rosa chinensis]
MKKKKKKKKHGPKMLLVQSKRKESRSTTTFFTFCHYIKPCLHSCFLVLPLKLVAVKTNPESKQHS